MVTIILVGVLLATLVIPGGICVQEIIARGKEIASLTKENSSLAEALLEYENVKLLSSGETAHNSRVDELIEKICTMEVTAVTSEKHSKKKDKKFVGLKPLITLEFNNGLIKLRDLADTESGWLTEMMYNGELFPRLTDNHRKRLRVIFMEKMAEAAILDISSPKPIKLLSEKCQKTDLTKVIEL